MNDQTYDDHEKANKQRYLGSKGVVVLIAVLSAFVPLSTDMYLPALPSMSDYFGVPIHLVNLTLILFFIFFSVGILIWGPLSDKYGRRPILIVGLALYVLASVACAVSWDIYLLIISRILQAFGGSAASAVSTAMVKDLYAGRERESVLAVVQSMVVISPALAPVLGAFILPYTSWRGLFWILSIIGVFSMIGCILLEETLVKKSESTVLRSLSRLGTVLKNPGFAFPLVLFSLVSTASLAFIADSSYIYETGFGLSPQLYSFYFAINAVALMLGPFLYIWFTKRYARETIVGLSFIVMILGGVMVSVFGEMGPMYFALALFPASLVGSMVRPAGAFLMLEQQKEDGGSASALINCFALVFGSIGMTIASLGGSELILVIGIINLAVGVVCSLMWLTIRKMKIMTGVS